MTQTKIKQRLISITKNKDCSNSLIGSIYMPAMKGPLLRLSGKLKLDQDCPKKTVNRSKGSTVKWKMSQIQSHYHCAIDADESNEGGKHLFE